MGFHFGQVAVAGDSSGGNLAAAAAVKARDRQVGLAAQVLVYPVLESHMDTLFKNTFRTRYASFLNRPGFGDEAFDRIGHIWDTYVPEPSLRDSPYVSPIPLREMDRSHSPTTSWRPWTAAIALLGGLVLAAVGALVVDLAASLLFGVSISNTAKTPPGLTIADTFVQDVAFVLVAVYCAQLGASVVRSWQFGLRRPGVGWGAAGGYVLCC